MNEFDLTIPSFQTFYVSKEESNCPLMPKIVRTGKKFKDLDVLKDIIGASISLKYGKRVLMNAKNSDIREIKRADLLEIVDYDPVKKVLLAIGPREPRVESSVHWLIHHARDEVNAVIQINDETIAEKLSKKLPTTEKEYPVGTLELAKEVLKVLRTSNKLVIKNQGLLFIGNNIEDAEKNALEAFEELK